MHFIGIDIGSVSVKFVLLDEKGHKLDGKYVRHYGHPVNVTYTLLKEFTGRHQDASLSITGSGGKIVASALMVVPVNEIVAQAYATKLLFPHVATIIEIGGEDAKLIILDKGRISDFSMNSVCAAGTGSFLEQQAERLRLTIEEFSEIAASSQKPSKIAGRCSVFAKSDMIHLQQIATPMEDIVSGLCFAVARNFKSTIAMGREISFPVCFQGGVAANRGMIRAFKEVLGIDDLIVPPDYALMGALGAALKDLHDGRINTFDIFRLQSFIESEKFADAGYPPLISESDGFFVRHAGSDTMGSGNDKTGLAPSRQPKITAYLGIDIGSISTNLAVIDETGRLLAKRYLMTAGRPIEAVMTGLEEINNELAARVEIAGVGTTGSGRYMIADYVGADIVKNEITAQATAALSIDPTVDTIFEIGGQDSKYISLRDSVIVDFEMNKACAAGTGSFLEEQAEKLNIPVKDEFAKQALCARNPCRLGERCTVFMENSLMSNLQRGADRDNLLAGLAYSIVQNYINRVVAGKPIGKKIFFQGGVAFNKSVVAAFEKYLSTTITVPPHHDVTGAIGMALIAMRHMKTSASALSGHQIQADQQVMLRKTSFKGFGLSQLPYEISSFECRGCPNVCEINKVEIKGESAPLCYGGRCEKYDVRRTQKPSLPDLFAYREELLWNNHLSFSETFQRKNSHQSRARIGIPYIFFFQDVLPFWSTLLWELGFEVIVSPKTNKQIVTLGVENVLSEACFPVKAAHGHIVHLKDTGVDAILIPSFINMNQKRDEYRNGLSCPHAQTIPYVSKAAIAGIEALSPIVDFSRDEKYAADQIHKALRRYGVRKNAVHRALLNAQAVQDNFRETIKEKGNEVLRDYGLQMTGSQSFTKHHEHHAFTTPLIVIIGRSYNAYDPGVNLEIPKKLATIGIHSLPMDFLTLRHEKLSHTWPNMYWRSGQRILKAARIIRNTPGLYALYIGNFSCGPDSFILKYFKEEMEGKPFLHIEIDEHSADAGAITRCEAFLDSIEQQRKVSGSKDIKKPSAIRSGQVSLHLPGTRKKTVYIPCMADHAFAIKAAFEYCGVPAEVLPPSDKLTVEIGKRFVSGKECYPYLVTAGDMLKKVFSPDFQPQESAFFMPSGTGPCRFGQYNVSHKIILDKLGFNDVTIFAPNQDVQFYRDLGIVGNEFAAKAWQGIVAYALLTKCLHETRPHEQCKGDAEGLHLQFRQRLLDALRHRNGAVDDLLKEIRSAFSSLPLKREQRPVIGIIGEIFVRSHDFSNEQLVKNIEALGGEVWLAPVEEWVHYVNVMSLRKALIKKDRSAMLHIFIKRLFQKRIEHKSARHFKDFLKTLEEPRTREILKKAAPYMHDSFEGETILSIGKAIDLIERGAAGIINAMPFGCMPGTIVTALLKHIGNNYGMPCISIPYDGTESSTTELQIETFMETIKNNISFRR